MFYYLGEIKINTPSLCVSLYQKYLLCRRGNRSVCVLAAGFGVIGEEVPIERELP